MEGLIKLISVENSVRSVSIKHSFMTTSSISYSLEYLQYIHDIPIVFDSR